MAKEFCPIIYRDWKPLFDSMSEHERSELLLAIVLFPSYTPDDVSTWEFFRQQLEKQYDFFTEKCNKNRAIAVAREEKKKMSGERTYTNVNERTPKPEYKPEYKPIDINVATQHTSLSPESDPQNGPSEPIPQKEKSPPIPYEKIVDLYNQMCVPGCVACLKLTPSRKQSIRLRAIELAKYWEAESQDDIIECFRRIFKRVSDSDFLMGRCQRSSDHANFKVDLSWILKSENLTKILEEKYA